MTRQWTHRDGITQPRPRPPADKTPHMVPNTPHRSHSELQLSAGSDRCQDSAATARRHQSEFIRPASRGAVTPRRPTTYQTALNPPPALDPYETPRGRPVVPLPRSCGPPTPSPGGSGDKLRRVYRWLESSVSVADPTERPSKRRHRTPSVAGTVSSGAGARWWELHGLR